MEDIKLPDSELKVMEVIWGRKGISAKEVADFVFDQFGWKKNTTYTILNKLVKKEYLERAEPGYICVPKISRSQVVNSETQSLLNKLYSGSVTSLFSCLLENKRLSQKELDEIKQLIDDNNKKG